MLPPADAPETIAQIFADFCAQEKRAAERTALLERARVAARARAEEEIARSRAAARAEELARNQAAAQAEHDARASPYRAESGDDGDGDGDGDGDSDGDSADRPRIRDYRARYACDEPSAVARDNRGRFVSDESVAVACPGAAQAELATEFAQIVRENAPGAVLAFVGKLSTRLKTRLPTKFLQMLASMAADSPTVLQALFTSLLGMLGIPSAAMNDSARAVLAAGIRGGSALEVFAEAGFSAASGSRPPPALAYAVANALVQASLPVVTVLATRLNATPAHYPHEYHVALISAIMRGDIERVRAFIRFGLPVALCGSSAVVQALLKAGRLDAAHALFAEKCFGAPVEPAAAVQFARATAEIGRLDCLEALASIFDGPVPAKFRGSFEVVAANVLACMTRRSGEEIAADVPRAIKLAAWALHAGCTNAAGLLAGSGRLLRRWLEKLPASAPTNCFNPPEESAADSSMRLRSQTRAGPAERAEPARGALERAVGAGFDLLETGAGLADIPAAEAVAIAAELARRNHALALAAFTLRFPSRELLAASSAEVAAFAIRTGRRGLLAWLLRRTTIAPAVSMKRAIAAARAAGFADVLVPLRGLVPAAWL